MKTKIPGLTACGGVGAAVALMFALPTVLHSSPPEAKSQPAGSDFSPYVSKDGDISRPVDYREKFQHLGSWAVAKKPDVSIFEMHNVYAPLKDIEAFRRNGKFPDGATLVKEITNVAGAEMTTGYSSWSTNNTVWFVMIKDSKGRFPNSGLWGDGWGWALFKADAPAHNVATDYTADCRTCHIPAKQDDWIYVRGYPTLKAQSPHH